MRSKSESLALEQAQLATFASLHPKDAYDAYNSLLTPNEYKSRNYKKFLKNSDSTAAASIAQRYALLSAYSGFEEPIDSLAESLAKTVRMLGRSALWERSDYLGGGRDANVFKLDADGRAYAVKFVADGRTQTLDSMVGVGLNAVGIPHSEQFAAASYDNKVILSHFVPGKTLWQASGVELEMATDRQLSDLANTATALGENGVKIDWSPHNLIYEPKDGFTVIDFHSKQLTSVADMNIANIAQLLAQHRDQPAGLPERFMEAASQK